MRVRVVGALVSSVVLVLALAGPGRAGGLRSRFVTCGETVNDTQSFRLANNLDCTGDGFIIASSGITIDLGGHLLRSNATGTGVTFQTSAHDVTLRNGTITEFDTNIRFVKSDGNTLSRLSVVDAPTALVTLSGNSNSIVRDTFARGGVIVTDSVAAGEADSNVFLGNTFAKALLRISGGDQNVVSKSRFLGPASPAQSAIVVVQQGATNGADENTIDANRVIGIQAAGITVSGDASDGNRITRNVSVGNGSAGTEDGISLADGDNTVIANNSVTGNNDNGIDLSGTAASAEISGNFVSGNAGVGIDLASGATNANIANNTVNNNGESGIVSTAANTTADTNVAKFNGFLNGLTNNTDFGIVLSGATPTGSGNNANGNDVIVPAVQCAPASLCVPPGAPVDSPPLLVQCDDAAPTSFTLLNPLDCATANPALEPGTDGVKIDLATMFVSGGAEAAISFPSPRAGIAIRRGSLVASNVGIQGLVRNSTFTGTVLSGMAGSGIDLVSGSQRNAFRGIVSVGNVDHGIHGANADLNVFSRVQSAANTGTGLDFEAAGPGETSSGNVITRSFSAGNDGDGIAFLDGDNNVVRRSTLTGNGENGVLIDGETNGAKNNAVRRSVLAANVGAGVLLVGDGLDNPPPPAVQLGAARNRIVGNTIATNAGEGIVIESDPESVQNVLNGNVVSANDGSGISIVGPGHQTAINRNIAKNNVLDGIFDNDGTNGKLVGNVANHNGFFSDGATPVDDNLGLGIRVVVDGTGCGNVARANDDPSEAFPRTLLRRC